MPRPVCDEPSINGRDLDLYARGGRRVQPHSFEEQEGSQIALDKLDQQGELMHISGFELTR